MSLLGNFIWHIIISNSVVGRLISLATPALPYLILTWNFTDVMISFLWIPLVISTGVLMIHEKKLIHRIGKFNWGIFIYLGFLSILIPELVGFIISSFAVLPNVSKPERDHWELISSVFIFGSSFAYSVSDTLFKRNIGKHYELKDRLLATVLLVSLISFLLLSLVFQNRLTFPFF